MRTSLFKKLTAAALAALMLLPLASCADPQDGESPADTSASSSAISSVESSAESSVEPSDESGKESDKEVIVESEPVDLDYECGLPDDYTYDGKKKTVTFLYVSAPGREDELVSDKLGGGTVSDSVFERNTAVQNRLGIRLAYVDAGAEDTAGQTIVTTTKASGNTDLDIFTLGTNWSVSCAIQGCYVNLNQVTTIDLNKHYWSQDYNKMMTFTADRKQFLATSPAAISLFRLTYLTLFNRDLMEDRQMPDLYDVVRTGEWTLEYQRNLISGLWEDRGNLNNTPDEEDFYGFVTGTCISIDAYPVTSGITLVTLDDNGYLMYDETQMSKMIDMAEKVSALYTDKGTYCFPRSEQDRIGLNNIMDKFVSSQALMVTTQFLSLETNIQALAAMNYGIVPMPKLSVDQQDYRTYVQDQVTSFGISAAIHDEERVEMLGALMESIAYQSNRIVRPAYYDSTLSLRFMQDSESLAILDTMFETIAFDYCFAVGVGGIRDDLRNRLSTASPGIASRATPWKRSVNRQLEKDNAALDKLGN